MLQQRQGAADDHCRHHSADQRERAPQTDYSPIVAHGREKIDWSDHSESKGCEQRREADAESGADQTAAAANLEGKGNGGETADQADDKKRRVDLAKEDAAPKAGEYG